MVNGKQKGASWERACCERLSLWVSKLTRSDLFWRAAMSGGRATLFTQKNRPGSKLLNQAGDISAIGSSDEEHQALVACFFLECKALASLQLDRVIFGKKGELSNIWEEPCEKSIEHFKIPLVIAKQNNQDPILLTTAEGAKILESGLAREGGFRLRAIFPEIGMHIYSFRDLLADLEYRRMLPALRAQVEAMKVVAKTQEQAGKPGKEIADSP